MEVKMAASSQKQTNIDTVPLPDILFGMPVKKGKVVKQQNNYYVLIGQKKFAVPLGIFVSEKDIAKLVDKDVFVIFSNTKPAKIIAITKYQTKPIKKWPGGVLCYLVGPDWPGKTKPEYQKFLINQLVKENIITKEFAKKYESDPMPAKTIGSRVNRAM
jgi:hypothetical protein